MASPNAKVMKFKIWTGEGGRFLKVFVWQSLSQMREYAIDRKPSWGGDKFLGCYLGEPIKYKWVKKKPVVVNKKMGEVHLWRGEVSPEIVSHEIMHYLNGWIGYLVVVAGVKDVNDEPHNENLSYQCGRLNRQFWQEYNSTNKKLLGRALA